MYTHYVTYLATKHNGMILRRQNLLVVLDCGASWEILILFGDHEKHGIGYEELSLGKRSLFNQFIQEMEVANVLWLVEVLLGTCLMEKLAKSKLDKFMVSCLWFNIFPSSTSFILERNISDRCPIIMKDLRVD